MLRSRVVSSPEECGSEAGSHDQSDSGTTTFTLDTFTLDTFTLGSIRFERSEGNTDMGQIEYNFAGLGDLSGNLQSEFTRLSDLADELKRQVHSLDAIWTSDIAKASYEQAQANWDRIFLQSRDQLFGLHRGVQNASNTMSELDGAIGRGFGSI